MRVQGGRAQRGQQGSRKGCRRGGGRAGKEPFPRLAVVQFADEAADDLIEYGAYRPAWPGACLGEVLHSLGERIDHGGEHLVPAREHERGALTDSWRLPPVCCGELVHAG